MRTRATSAVRMAGLVALFVPCGCDVETLLHQTASFGGDTAGERGSARLLFINNTPYRAVFTAGVYDGGDPNAQPLFWQFGNDPDGVTLEGNSTSDIFKPICARVFSIGTAPLLRLIKDNIEAKLPDVPVNRDAMITGVLFSSSEEDALRTEGVASAFEARLGVDFACNSFLIIRLEFDDVGMNRFRVDFEVIPGRDDRGESVALGNEQRGSKLPGAGGCPEPDPGWQLCGLCGDVCEYCPFGTCTPCGVPTCESLSAFKSIATDAGCGVWERRLVTAEPDQDACYEVELDSGPTVPADITWCSDIEPELERGGV